MNQRFHIAKRLPLPTPRETTGLSAAGLRDAFLVQNLFAPSELRVAVSEMDRLVLGGVMPTAPMLLPPCPDFGTRYFAERREIGLVNLGAPGHVRVNGNQFSVGHLSFLYIGAGNEEIVFEPCAGTLPCFYFLSCPAHRELPVAHIARDQAESELIGDASCASLRKLSKFIHPGGASSCQLVMGLTELQDGSVWNTMPPHTHSRRSEVYLYSGLDDGAVVHLMGEPGQTRHLVVRDREAVLSPSWSVHFGAGTRPYSFIWGMAGENQSFSDIDPVELSQLR